MPWDVRGDFADAHRHPQRLAGLYFQARTEFADSRHNPAMQHEPAQAKEQPGRGDKPQQHAQDEGKPLQAARRQGGRLGIVGSIDMRIMTAGAQCPPGGDHEVL
jgi:hypothetical protein